MDAKLILSFLDKLIKNNNREWFHANKGMYEAAKKEFENFVGMIIPEVAKFDEGVKNIIAKDCLFRIYNDIRFAKNKPPYKINFGASIARGGKIGGSAGYYLHIEKGTSFIAGGIYLPPPDKLKLIRQEIYYNYKEYSAILNHKSFQKYFSEIDDYKLSRVPKEFPKDAVAGEMLKYKSFTASYHVSEKQLLSGQYKKLVIDVFKALAPFNCFLNRAVYDTGEK